MRYFTCVLAVILATAAFAQDRPNSFYVFISDPQYVWSDSSGSDFNAGYGVALQRMFNEWWSGEITASHRSSRSVAYIYNVNGNVVQTIEFRAHVTPVDITAQYHFLNDTAWKPYLGAGYSHVFVDANNGVAQRAGNFFVVNGGVVWRVRPELGIRLDGKVRLGDHPSYIDSNEASIGVAWRF